MQEELPHKQFISALVRCQVGVSLPLELDFSLGMYKYQVLFTWDQGAFSVYLRELGRYALTEKDDDAGEGSVAKMRLQKEIVQALVVAASSKAKTAVEP